MPVDQYMRQIANRARQEAIMRRNAARGQALTRTTQASGETGSNGKKDK